MAEIEVLHSGLISTIQDWGRRGFSEYGVPVSGPMDSYAAELANTLLQNDAGAAVLEITQMGPKLRFSGPSEIVISGADLSPILNGEKIQNNKIYIIEKDDILSFGRRKFGCRAYLAVKNGFLTEEFLGSASWYSSVTGFSKLEKGMRLKYSEYSATKKVKFASVKIRNYLKSEVVEAFPGPEYELLSAGEKNVLQKSHFSVDRNSNRMGIQLQEKLENRLEPILTGPVLPGTVQLTPGGKLIVLMRDGQTTGGYPRVLQLSEDGINVLAQKVPGEKIRFLLKS